ncbi:branched-chain amino acid transport system II carrier protein, partial [Staphylococcus aureus]|nr:branched-chain amino acid transport system II carrier protein [Staphylococcus aureus]
ATVVSFISFLFANVGLTKIIMYSVPVLMFLYPLAIALIVLTLSDIGMGWVVLSLIGFIIGFIIYKIKHRKIPQA